MTRRTAPPGSVLGCYTATYTTADGKTVTIRHYCGRPDCADR